MLVVVAHSHDELAKSLASRWAPREVGVLTPRDLAVAGWTFRTDDPARSTAVVQGRRVKSTEISGVLVRLLEVNARELNSVAPGEREYAAEEMTALLAAWLASLECRVLNPPGPSALISPVWGLPRWRLVAARLGVPVAAGVTNAAIVPLTVVGKRCLGCADLELQRQARELAAAAGVDMLVARFTGPTAGARFVDADSWADVSDEGVAAAILEHLVGPGT